MPSYTAPTDDTKFLIIDWLRIHERPDIPSYEELSPEFVDAVLSGMARYAENVTFPINMIGDRQGCRWQDGDVRTPDGFKEAFDQYREDGWFGLATSEDFGGQGLPTILSNATTEYLVGSNPGFGMFIGLNKSATILLECHGSEEQKSLYIPRFASGEWTATMDMTEAGAGSDLGLMRSKATQQPDGTYRLSGTKTFISSGEHDLSENIVHLVLAKIPGGPEGSKGISLFIVPKILVSQDGTLGARNAVFCESIEEKMGLHGSATCTMRFDASVAYLVGAEHDGLRPMFEMMNATRIFVGMQATGICDVAYQNALNYSRERTQGRTPKSKLSPNQAEPIIVHPDVRRMLMFCKSFSEGARALCLWTSFHLDIAERHPDPLLRARHSELVAFLTPVVKGYISDIAEHATSNALQCFGGHGYIVETGIEQYYRDVRVTRIYEGTSGIQALDLLGRKVLALGGGGLRILMEEIELHLAESEKFDSLADFDDALRSVTQDLSAATEWFTNNSRSDLHSIGAAATHYLSMAGIVIMTFVWSQVARACVSGDHQSSFHKTKVATGRFFIQQFCPDTTALLAKIHSGSAATMALAQEDF